MEKQKILLYGGTFDPIHNGHLRIAQEAIQLLRFDKVVFIPSFIPSLKKNPQNYSHRLRMTKLATKGIQYFKVSDIESKTNKTSYTINTIRNFKKELKKDAQIYWLIGDDTIKDLKKWYKIKELLQECIFVVASRSVGVFYNRGIFGYLAEENLTKEPIHDHFILLKNEITTISSSRIKKDLYDDVKYAVKYLVPKKVERYIYEHKLYQKEKNE